MNDELLAVVDENDQVIDNLPRHRAVYILVFNQLYIHGDNGDALLQCSIIELWYWKVKTLI